MATDKKEKQQEKKTEETLEGSQSDPQQTELEGLKKGGVEPPVHPQDEENFKEGELAEKDDDEDDDA